MKNSAEVIPRRSSGAENTLQTMMIATMVATATMRSRLHLPTRPAVYRPGAILQPSTAVQTEDTSLFSPGSDAR